MSTPIFTPKQVIQYAETRLFGRNVQPDMVKEINLYNATLPSPLERKLAYPQRVIQEKGREPLYYNSSSETLHIPQYSGFGRRRRYEEMIKAYATASGREITFQSLERDNNHRQTNIFYDNFAYDFVKGLFMLEPMDEINTIVVAPLEAVEKQSDILRKKPDEYLDSQLVNVGKNTVLNLGYIYADQAGIIVDKMMREYEALARRAGNQRDLSILMAGRVGGLLEQQQRHDLVFPTSIIDEVDLQQGRPLEYPMHNVLARQQSVTEPNLNVGTVINETVEQLQAASAAGCICVEMETRETVESINRARRRYVGTLNIQFGFVGYVSDLPLRGDTLARELESEEGERKAVGVIMDFMEKDQRKDAQGGRR